MMTDERAAIRREHFPTDYGPLGALCECCHDYPCRDIRLLDALEAAEARIAELEGQLETAVTALQAIVAAETRTRQASIWSCPVRLRAVQDTALDALTVIGAKGKR